MLLEKIRQHAGKILFLLTGVLLFLMGTVVTKQRSLNQESVGLEASKLEALKLEADKLSARREIEINAVQEAIATDRQQKMESIASNPLSVIKQETVPVTKVIPGATRKITVPLVSSTKSTKTVKKATPAKTTKTS